MVEICFLTATTLVAAWFLKNKLHTKAQPATHVSLNTMRGSRKKFYSTLHR